MGIEKEQLVEDLNEIDLENEEDQFSNLLEDNNNNNDNNANTQ